METTRRCTLHSYKYDIRVILHIAPRKSVYLAPLCKGYVSGQSFLDLESRKHFDSEVDYGELKVLADVKMTHAFNKFLGFNPTFEEVVSQIPEDIRDEVCAFEVVYGPMDDTDFDIFAEDLVDGKYVYVVRLYTWRQDGEEAAKPPFRYPKGATTPLGMNETDFEMIREYVDGQWL